jgi:hypothetical protein
MLAWNLASHGWDCEILCPSISLQPTAWIDPASERLFAPNIKVIEAKPMPFAKILRRMGVRSLGWQALLPVYLAGSKLLRGGRFDLVLFSTTAFNFFCLGNLWRKRFGVPYILDFQDPWYRERPALIATTKHRWKARIASVIASMMEGWAVNGARALISVSPNYLSMLKRRYPDALVFTEGRVATIPFGAREADFGGLGESGSPRGPLTIGYVGAGAALMARSFGRILRSIANLQKAQPDLANMFRIRLVGTQGDWREGEPIILKNLAASMGMADLVEEEPRTVSYSEAIRIANSSDGLLVLGVDEPAYMASKLFSYASMCKPILASISRQSQMNVYFERYTDLGLFIHFDDDKETEDQIDARVLEFLTQILIGYRPLRIEVRRDYSDATMTEEIVKLFDACTPIVGKM